MNNDNETMNGSGLINEPIGAVDDHIGDQAAEQAFPSTDIPTAAFDDDGTDSLLPDDEQPDFNKLCSQNDPDAFIRFLIDENLPTDIDADNYMTKSDAQTSLIASVVLALVLALSVVFGFVFHRNAPLLVIICLIAFFVYYKLMKRLKKNGGFLKKAKKLPDEDIRLVINSEAVKAKKRSTILIRNLVLIGVCFVVALLFFIEPHMIFEKNDSGYTLRYYTASIVPQNNVMIPETYKGEPVTEIRGQVFQNLKKIQSIHLPSSITEIRGNTFENCSSLRAIVIPDGVTRIAAHAFYGCSKLSSVKLPDSLQSIGSSAFRLCNSLQEIYIPAECSVNEKAFKESPTHVFRYRLEEETLPEDETETTLLPPVSAYDPADGEESAISIPEMPEFDFSIH